MWNHLEAVQVDLGDGGDTLNQVKNQAFYKVNL